MRPYLLCAVMLTTTACAADPAAAPDEIRRWRVDPAPAAADGATAMVTLPPHAIPDGAYVITVWEGDARVVARYTFQARKAP